MYSPVLPAPGAPDSQSQKRTHTGRHRPHVSGSEDTHPLMLPTALRLARMIEQRLIDESSLQEKLVLQQFFFRKNRSVRGPVVFLGPRSMLSNAAASRLVAPADEMLLRDVAHQIVTEGQVGCGI